jgi:hypothetical protein
LQSPQIAVHIRILPLGDHGSASSGKDAASSDIRTAGSRGLPDSAAPVAGNDPAPPACARIADEPAAPARPGGADRYCDGDAAAAADATRNLAAAGRRNATPDTVKGTLLVELQLPAVVARPHSRPVKGARPDDPRPPGGVGGTGRGPPRRQPRRRISIARRALRLHRQKRRSGRAEIVIFSCFLTAPRRARVGYVKQPGSTVHRCQSGWALP